MQQHQVFLTELAHQIASSPFLFVNEFSDSLFHTAAGISLGEDGNPHLDDTVIETIQQRTLGALHGHTASTLLKTLTNASCPALPKIREIAEACCIVLETCYEHALTK